MRKILFFAVSMMAMTLFMNSCKTEKNGKGNDSDSLASDTAAVQTVKDTTMYGICGEGTSMHNLEFIRDNGDTLNIFIDEEEGSDVPGLQIVQGGLYAGDRMAVTAVKDVDGEFMAHRIINLKTLEGKWSNRDMVNSTIEFVEDGTISATQMGENGGYAAWHICNGNLVLSPDTFMILNLGADSLELEGKKGISVFKRMK